MQGVNNHCNIFTLTNHSHKQTSYPKTHLNKTTGTAAQIGSGLIKSNNTPAQIINELIRLNDVAT